MERIGVIGLGLMGSAIARRMQAQGHVVTGWTRSGRPTEGVTQVVDLEQLIQESDTLILSLFDDRAVEEMLDRLLDHDLTGKQIIEASTVLPEILKNRIAKFIDLGASAVDAPISGGPELVAAGQCGVFIGGDDAGAARAARTLASLTGRVFHVGPPGAGLVMKTINNSMIQSYFAAMFDIMPLAQKAGLPLETAIKILSGGPAGLPMVADRIPKILGEDKAVGVSIATTMKDNEMFQRVLGSFGLTSGPMATYGASREAVRAAGLQDADPAALVKLAYDGALKAASEG